MLGLLLSSEFSNLAEIVIQRFGTDAPGQMASNGYLTLAPRGMFARGENACVQLHLATLRLMIERN